MAPPVKLALGATYQYTALGHYADGFTANWTDAVVWTSSSPSIASIDAHGLLTAIAPGSVVVTASRGLVSSTTSLQVVALASIELTPNSPSINLGTTQQFTAIGHYTDSSTSDITSTVTWATSNPSVATIDSSGLANTVSDGSTTITASLSGHSSSTTLTSHRVLQSISLAPTTSSIVFPATQQFAATGHYNDSTTANLTSTVTWGSTSTSVATINSSGLATSHFNGSTTISATSGSVSANTSLAVTNVLQSIAVTPANTSAASNGVTQQFTATGTYNDGATANLTSTVTWASTVTANVTINSSGLATTHAVGASTISATMGSISGSTVFTSALVLLSIAVTPANPSVLAGNTDQFTATGTYSDGSTQNLTSTATWVSTNTAAATINSSGLATTIASGSTTIRATSGSVQGSTTLTVTASSPSWTLATATLANTTSQGGASLSNGNILVGDNIINGTTFSVSATSSSNGYGDQNSPPSWNSNDTNTVYRMQVFAQTTTRLEYLSVSGGTWTATALFDSDPGGTHSYTQQFGAGIAVSGGYLMTGGNTNNRCYKYTKSGNSWAQTGSMTTNRERHRLVTMASGNVMAIAGTTTNNGAPIASCEIFNGSTWSATGSLNFARKDYAVLVLSSGKIFVVGGTDSGNAVVDTPEMYDPGTGIWTNKAVLIDGSSNDLASSGSPIFHSLAELSDGKIMYRRSNNTSLSFPDYIYNPTANTWDSSESGPTTTFNSDGFVPGRLFANSGTVFAVESKNNSPPASFWTRPR